MLLLYGLQVAYDTWYDAPNSQKPRGRALIIANSSFHSTRLADRNGTELDVRKLKDVFTWLNFEVIVRNDLTSQVRYSAVLITYCSH